MASTPNGIQPMPLSIRPIRSFGWRSSRPETLGVPCYDDPYWTAFLELCNDTGTPINFHLNAAINPNALVWKSFSFEKAISVASNMFYIGNLATMGNWMVSGLLDRHPKLRIVFAEGGLNWAAGALQDAELTYEVHREMLDPMPKLRPTEYWRNHCYATFQTDAIGLQLLDRLGADRVMWAQDYPHSEGTFGFTAQAIQEVLDATSEADARLILGETAASLYKLN